MRILKITIEGLQGTLEHIRKGMKLGDVSELENLIYRKYFSELDLLAVECKTYLDKKFGLVRSRSYHVVTDEDIDTLRAFGDKLEKKCFVVVTFKEIKF